MILLTLKCKKSEESYFIIPLDAEDITPDMIQKTVKLHFTIGVLRLFSNKEVDDARTALAKFAPQIPYLLQGQPLKVRTHQ